MNDPAVILLGWVALMSVAGFVLMGVDKYRARRDMWRIPEKTLFTCALLGGTPGVILGMNRFRHSSVLMKAYVVKRRRTKVAPRR